MKSLALKKPKSYTKTIHGVVFWPAERPKNFFPGIHAWIEKGCPDKATVYDHADHLQVCGITITDALLHRGVYIRLPHPIPAKEKTFNVLPLTTSKLLLAEKKSSVNLIQAANTQEHHKLHR
jgi:hypothetical protein